MSYRSIAVHKLNPSIGARIEGVDLSEPLSPLQFEEISRAWMDNLVLQFDCPDLTSEQQLTFARRFGVPHVHPAMRKDGHGPEIMTFAADANTEQVAGENWHSDVTCDDEPPSASILYILEAPPDGGGDTLFANMYMAYEALSEPIKRMLLGLNAVHDSALAFRAGLGKDIERPRSEHPVVRTHPVTGRRALFVNALYTSHIVGLNRNESASILDMLYRHMETPEFSVRAHWRAGILTMWDNRCAQHRAIWDYYPQRRAGRRVSVVGDRPFLRLEEGEGAAADAPAPSRLFNLRPMT